MAATATAARTLSDILIIRRRAALQRVAEHNAGAVKVAQAMGSAVLPSMHQADLDKAAEAQRLAVKELALVDAEIAAACGAGGPEGAFEASTAQGGRRYAAQLMIDNPALDPHEALRQAQVDENTRFEAYCVRHKIGQVNEDDLEA